METTTSATTVGLGIAGLLFMIFIAIVAFMAFVFWIWMLIDAIRNQGLTGTERLIWALVIFFLHFLGALIYFFVGRSKRNAVIAG